MPYALKILKLVDAAVVKITRLGVILGMLTLFVLLMIRIIARATEIPFVAFDEIGELATVWMILFGVVAMWREGSLYSVEFFFDKSNRVVLLLNLIVQLVMFTFAVILVWQGGKFTLMSRESSAFLLIDMRYYYGAIPLAAAAMALYSAKAILQRINEIATRTSPKTFEHDADINGSPGHF